MAQRYAALARYENEWYVEVSAKHEGVVEELLVFLFTLQWMTSKPLLNRAKKNICKGVTNEICEGVTNLLRRVFRLHKV